MHNLLNLFALLVFVAMDGTLPAAWFGLAIGALGQTRFRVTHQFGTVVAQAVSMLAVVVFAIDSGHAQQGPVFTFQSADQWFHESTLARL